MTDRRSKLEIYVEILEEIRSGTIKPTKIMYATNLSWTPLQQMLTSLINEELVEEYESEEHDERTNKVYRITEKAQSVLLYFGKVKGLFVKEKPVEIMNWR